MFLFLSMPQVIEQSLFLFQYKEVREKLGQWGLIFS